MSWALAAAGGTALATSTVGGCQAMYGSGRALTSLAPAVDWLQHTPAYAFEACPPSAPPVVPYALFVGLVDEAAGLTRPGNGLPAPGGAPAAARDLLVPLPGG